MLPACCSAAAAITDYFDGKLARTRRQQSDLGRMLDPIADKLLVGAALMMLVGQGRLSTWGLYPAIVIMLREILVSGLREYLAGIRIGLPVTPAGQMEDRLPDGRARHAARRRLVGAAACTCRSCRSATIGEVMLWVAAALTLWTGWDYLTAGVRHASGPRPGAGLPKRQLLP